MKSDAQRPASKLDGAGAVCSTVCAVHCASSAMAPGVLAVLGVGALAGPALEWGFTVAAILFAILALIVGWGRHRNPYLALLFVAGIAGLGLGRWLEMLELHHAGPAASIAAGLSLIAAHSTAIVLGRRPNA